MRRPRRPLRMELLEPRTLLDGSPLIEAYELPDEFNARAAMSPTDAAYYLDTVGMPHYEDLENRDQFELLWGQSFDEPDLGLELGIYLGGSSFDVERQVYLGSRHVYKDTGQESFFVAELGSVIPMELKEKQDRAIPLTYEEISEGWGATVYDLILNLAVEIPATRFEQVINLTRTYDPSYVIPADYLRASRILKNVSVLATTGLSTALDVYYWQADKKRAIQYGADLAKPVGVYDYESLMEDVQFQIVGGPITVDVTQTWNSHHPEYDAILVELILTRQEAVVERVNEDGALVEYVITRYALSESVDLSDSTRAGWVRTIYADVDFMPVDSSKLDLLQMQNSVRVHHRKLTDNFTAARQLLTTAYQQSQAGGVLDLRKTMIQLVDAVRIQDYAFGGGSVPITHTIGALLDTVYLDRELVWAAWDRPLMPSYPHIGHWHREGEEPIAPPALLPPEEIYEYVAGTHEITPAPPPDTTPPWPLLPFLSSPTRTRESTFVLSGITEPNALVTAENRNAVGIWSSRADTDGRFHITVRLEPDATNRFSLTAKDSAGNESLPVNLPPITHRGPSEQLQDVLPLLLEEQPFDPGAILQRYGLSKKFNKTTTVTPNIRRTIGNVSHFSDPSMVYYSIDDSSQGVTTPILEVTLEHISYDLEQQRKLADYETTVLISLGESPIGTAPPEISSTLFQGDFVTSLTVPSDPDYDFHVNSGEPWKHFEDFVARVVAFLEEDQLPPAWVSDPINRRLIQEGPSVRAFLDLGDYEDWSKSQIRLWGATDDFVLYSDGVCFDCDNKLYAYDRRTEKIARIEPPGYRLLDWNIPAVYSVAGKIFFLAATAQENRYVGYELWVTDGTSEGTRMVENTSSLDDDGWIGDLQWKTSSHSFYGSSVRRPEQYMPSNFVAADGGLYFVQFRDMEYPLKRKTVGFDEHISLGRRYDVYYTDGDTVTKIMSQDFDGGRFYFADMFSNDAGTAFLVTQQSAFADSINQQDFYVTFQLTPEGPRPVFDQQMMWAFGDLAQLSGRTVVNLRTGERFEGVSGTVTGELVRIFSVSNPDPSVMQLWRKDASIVEVPARFPHAFFSVGGQLYAEHTALGLYALEDGQWERVSHDFGFEQHGTLLVSERQLFGSVRAGFVTVGNDSQTALSDNYVYVNSDGVIYQVNAEVDALVSEPIDLSPLDITFAPPTDDLYVHSRESIPLEIMGRYSVDGVTATKIAVSLPEDYASFQKSIATQGKFVLLRHFPFSADNMHLEFWLADPETKLLSYLSTPVPYRPLSNVYDEVVVTDEGLFVQYEDEVWKLDGDKFVVVDAMPEPYAGSSPSIPGISGSGDAVTGLSIQSEFAGAASIFYLLTPSEPSPPAEVAFTDVVITDVSRKRATVAGQAPPGSEILYDFLDLDPVTQFKVCPDCWKPVDAEGRFEIHVSWVAGYSKEIQVVHVKAQDGYVTTVELPPWDELLHPFKNQANEYDANGDGVVSPLDALLVINRLNHRGAGALPGVRTESDETLGWIDTNGDRHLTPLDALRIINLLNEQAATASGEAERERDHALVDELQLDTQLIEAIDRFFAAWNSRSLLFVG